MAIQVTRKLEWDAAHRVLRHESKCATLHGHRYVAEVTLEADELDSVGRVVDFGVVKEKLGSWIDREWDHTTLVNEHDIALLEFTRSEHAGGKRRPYVFMGEPTAENIAKELWAIGVSLLESPGSGLRMKHVRVYETPNCWADYEQSR